MRPARLFSTVLTSMTLAMLIGCSDETQTKPIVATTNTTTSGTMTTGPSTANTTNTTTGNSTGNTTNTTTSTTSTTTTGTATTVAALPDAPNLNVAITTTSVPDLIAALNTALTAAGPISVVATLDHAQNAAGAGETLEPTQVIFFGNPKLGTPLMQKNQLAGLDLPQRMLAYSTGGTTYLVYTPTDYIAQRHDVADVPTLAMISGALSMFAKNAAGAEVIPTQAQPIAPGQGIVTVPSAFDVATTYSKLKAAIEAKEPLNVVFELDHQANAQKVELELRPTRLIAFGNPKLGTPLMQAERSIGLDLPQKMLVWENAQGQVFISYNDPSFLAARHGLDTSLPQIATIATALEGLSKEATEGAQ